MSDSIYFLSIDKEGAEDNENEAIACAYGDAAEIGFIIKRRLKGMKADAGTEYTVKLAESYGYGAEDKTPLLSFTGDGSSAALLLGNKLKTDLKPAKSASASADTDGGTVETSGTPAMVSGE